ncbi:DUF397 domain-containing protein [Kibdelosporangium aridum]|uniref:DUF397 domain-containing protein n=1 Tax=Kibdelosporangium aridum TaxID=2030 RepID=A0A1W2ASA6_KIBAR|nr:DUF397 domain-containing protein [Kibdelosporangium aridum]SMC63597.1 protein of unknown function [Kibdelosporangium aridum]
MTAPAGWKKATHSVNGSDCVEVRSDLRAIRDTKNPDHSIHADVRALVTVIKAGF